MTGDELDAIKALAHRLTDWGVDGAADKAKLYVSDLVNHGWVMQAHARHLRRPPMKNEECRTHAGEWADFCRCCVADRKAAADLATSGPRLTVEEAKAMARDAIRTTPQPAQVAGAENEESL